MPTFVNVPHPGIAGVTAPVVDELVPRTTLINTPVQITVFGAGFLPNSAVEGDGSGLVTHYVSDSQLLADIPGIATPGPIAITVVTGAMTSNAVNFSVTLT